MPGATSSVLVLSSAQPGLLRHPRTSPWSTLCAASTVFGLLPWPSRLSTCHLRELEEPTARATRAHDRDDLGTTAEGRLDLRSTKNGPFEVSTTSSGNLEF